MRGCCRFRHVLLFEILWSVAHQGPLSKGFSRQEYWSELSCPPLRDLPDPGIKPSLLRLLHCRQILYCWAPGEALLAKATTLKFLNALLLDALAYSMAISQFTHPSDKPSFLLEFIGSINLALYTCYLTIENILQAYNWSLKMVFQNRCHLGKRKIKKKDRRGYSMYKDLEWRERSSECIGHTILFLND